MWIKEENPKYDSRKKELFEKYETNFNFGDVSLGVSLNQCWWKLVINDEIYGYAFHYLRKEFSYEIEVVIDGSQQGKGLAKRIIRIMEEDIVEKGGIIVKAVVYTKNKYFEKIDKLLKEIGYNGYYDQTKLKLEQIKNITDLVTYEKEICK